jgi:hypothetical protein
MQDLANQLRQDADKLSQCDSLCRACNALDDMKRKLSACKSCTGKCKGGSCASCNGSGDGSSAFVTRSNKKGGLKAGWGTADNWAGGGLEQTGEVLESMEAMAPERAGAATSFSITSPDERARSALASNEQFAELVQKAEADLDLETVPLSYREYLRRYFQAISPEDTADDASAEGHHDHDHPDHE